MKNIAKYICYFPKTTVNYIIIIIIILKWLLSSTKDQILKYYTVPIIGYGIGAV